MALALACFWTRGTVLIEWACFVLVGCRLHFDDRRAVTLCEGRHYVHTAHLPIHMLCSSSCHWRGNESDTDHRTLSQHLFYHSATTHEHHFHVSYRKACKVSLCFTKPRVEQHNKTIYLHRLHNFKDQSTSSLYFSLQDLLGKNCN